MYCAAVYCIVVILNRLLRKKWVAQIQAQEWLDRFTFNLHWKLLIELLLVIYNILYGDQYLQRYKYINEVI